MSPSKDAAPELGHTGCFLIKAMAAPFTRSKELAKMTTKQGKKRQPEEPPESRLSGPDASPTNSLAAKKLKQQLDKEKAKVKMQSEQIAELKQEMTELREQLNSMKSQTIEVDSQSSLSESTQSSTDSSDSSSSSADDFKKRKKGKQKEKKGKKQKKSKKDSKKGKTVCHRAQDPDEVVSRYKAVLNHYKKKKSFVSAYKTVGVDRNTIVTMAPIAELAIVDPPTFEELASTFSRKQKLLDFAQKCSATLKSLNVQDKIQEYKNKLKLLPLMKRQ